MSRALEHVEDPYQRRLIIDQAFDRGLSRNACIPLISKGFALHHPADFHRTMIGELENHLADAKADSRHPLARFRDEIASALKPLIDHGEDAVSTDSDFQRLAAFFLRAEPGDND